MKNWDIYTLIIIFFTILVSSLFAKFSVKRKFVLNRYYHKVEKISYRKLYVLISYLIVVAIVGLQQSNSDYLAYVNLYKYSYGPTPFSLFQVEPLFKLLNRIIYLIYDEPQLVFLLMTMITYFFAYKAIYYFSEKCKIDIFCVMFVYLSIHFLISFGMLRQMAATAIIFYSYKYVFERNFMKYLILLVIAFGFHSSALFSLPIYFFINTPFKDSIIKNIYRVLMCIIIYIIILSFDFLIPLLFGNSNRDYSIYLQIENVGLGNLVKRIPIMIILLIFFNIIKKSSRIISNFILLIIFEISLVFTYYYMPILGGRIIYYILPAYSILIPYFSSKIKIYKINFSYIVCVIYGISYIIIQLLKTNWITEYLMPIKFFKIF